MLQTIYTLVVMGTMALWHMFCESMSAEYVIQLTELENTRARIPEPVAHLPEPVRRNTYTYYEESPAVREIGRRIDSNIAMFRLMNNHNSRAQEPLAYRVRRPASVPRVPLTPEGTSPADRCTDCSICMENSNNSLPACRIGACGHVFHTSCLRPWLANNPTCPNCRAAV